MRRPGAQASAWEGAREGAAACRMGTHPGSAACLRQLRATPAARVAGRHAPVSSSARPSLPLQVRTSDTPMPSVVGTAANRVRPAANSLGTSGMARKAKPRQGVTNRMLQQGGKGEAGAAGGLPGGAPRAAGGDGGNKRCGQACFPVQGSARQAYRQAQLTAPVFRCSVTGQEARGCTARAAARARLRT